MVLDFSKEENNFKWAVRMMREGEKVRRRKWREDSYWFFDCDGVITWGLGNEEERVARVYDNQLKATDWEIYNERKQKYNCELCGKFICKFKLDVDLCGGMFIDDKLICDDCAKKIVKRLIE